MTRDRRSESRRLQVVVLALVVVGIGAAAALVWGASVALPALQSMATDVFAPGIGLKTSAIIAAVVSFLALVVMATVAGDGIIGEIQFLIPGFFLFFLFFWLMTAWVF